MSWRDKLRAASFRGVPFKVLDVGTEVGRRNVLHQYPFREEPYLEDMGLDADTFVVNAYILQSRATADSDLEYFAERDALIAALKAEGPGVLVHPFLGEFKVGLAGKARISESFLEQGIARITMTFTEAGRAELPAVFVDAKGAVDVAVEEAITKQKESFAEKYDVDGESGFSITSALSTASSAISMVRASIVSVRQAISGTIKGALDELSAIEANITAVVNAPAAFAADIESTVNTFATLVGAIGDTVDPANVSRILSRSAAKACTAISGFGGLFGEDGPSSYGGQIEGITVNTDTRARQSANQKYIANLVRNIALTRATQIVIRMDFDSVQEAVEMSDLVTNAMDIQLETMGDEAGDSVHAGYGVSIADDESYAALNEARATFVRSMAVIGSTLPKVIGYGVPAAVVPTLVLAYNQYEDLDRAEDIFNRNRPQVYHPGFLPQGQTIEVLDS